MSVLDLKIIAFSTRDFQATSIQQSVLVDGEIVPKSRDGENDEGKQGKLGD